MKKGIISIVSGTVGAMIGANVMKTKYNNKEWEYRDLSDKHLALMLLLNQWLTTKQKGKSIVDYLKEQKIQSIAIYGMSYIGERLYDELVGTEIEIKYAIDKKKNSIYPELKVVSIDDELDKVDAIIVTPVFFFDDIYEELSKRTDMSIFSLEDILYEM